MRRREFIKKGLLYIPTVSLFIPRHRAGAQAFTLNDLPYIAQNPPAVGGGGGPTVAPVFLAGTAFGASNAGSTTLTATVTVLAGSNRLMLITVGQGNSGGTAKTINSVVYNTTENATAISGFTKSDGNFCALSGFYLVAPSVATGVSLTVTFATAPGIACIQCSTYTGAAQSGTIFGTVVTGSSTANTTATVNVTSGTGQMNWAGASTDANGAITIGGTSSPTSRQENEGVSSDMGFGIGECVGTGSFQWTWSAPDNGWAMCAVPVNGL